MLLDCVLWRLVDAGEWWYPPWGDNMLLTLLYAFELDVVLVF
jgi:hypothetical protein